MAIATDRVRWAISRLALRAPYASALGQARLRIAVIAVILFHLALCAAAQEPIDTKQPPRARELVYGAPIATGHVIVAGRRLARPYRLGRQGRHIVVDGERIAELPGVRAQDGKQPREPAGSDPDRFVADLEHWLYEDYAIIVFDERIRIVADPEKAARFLASLVQARSLDERVTLALGTDIDVSDDGAPHRISTVQWKKVLADFQATDSLLAFIDELDADDDVEEPAVYEAPPDTSAKKMYALSVTGMVLVAISIGTLLNHRPESGPWSQPVESAAAIRLVKHALVLIILLSAFDLACTLLATTTSDFLEVNPFGESLLSKPWMLSAFKLTATVVAAGILWSIRSFRGAQQASWWLCLVLTLVTVRWVAVQSLFFV